LGGAGVDARPCSDGLSVAAPPTSSARLEKLHRNPRDEPQPAKCCYRDRYEIGKI
jgi:hypothetical protein